VPPHTLAWTYNPASNETIVYVNPTDGSLDVGDAGLMEIHLQGVVSVAKSDFVFEPDAAAVAAALEGIDPALLVTTASDGTVLTTGSAQAAPDAAVSESSPVTASIWAMPADDGLRFHFGRDRIDSIASIKLAVFGDNPAYAAEASNDGAVTAPTHVSSIELADSHAPVLTEEQLTSREDPTHAATGATTIGHGKGHAAAGVEASELGVTAQSAAIASAAAAIVGSSVITGNGDSQHSSHSADAEAAAADLTEPDGTTGNGGGHGNSQHTSNSAAKAAAADLTEPDGATGNGGGHGNSQHASNPAAAKASSVADPAEATPANSGGHGQTFHFNNKVAAFNDSPAVEQKTGDPHVFPDRGADLADIETGPPAGEENLPSHANNGHHNSIGHSHHELLV
jgi:hypothetical protein